MTSSYVISLENPNKLIKYLRKYKFEPTWIRGINYKYLTDDEINSNTTSFYSTFGPKSSIAIALTHMKAWRTFLSSKSDYAVFFEDDVVFEPNFVEYFENSMKAVPHDFDILYLGCFGCQSDTNCMTIPMSVVYNTKETKIVNKYINKPKVALALHAYVLSKKGAAKLLSFVNKKIDNHLDIMIFKLYTEDKLNLYSLNNRIAFQTSSHTCDSLNTTSYPILINKIFSFVELDKMVKLNYYSSVSFMRIGKYNINLNVFLIFIIGVFVGLFKVDIATSSIIFCILSLADILLGQEIDYILFCYVIFIIPSLISNNI